MKTLSQLNFGYTDAQNYLDGQPSLHFKNCFLADQHLTQLKDRKVYFLIGEKGTGKTAYAAYLSQYSESTYNGSTVFVQPTDYYNLVSMQLRLGDRTVADYSDAWQLALLTAFFHRTNTLFPQIDSGPVAAIRQALDHFLLGTYGGEIADSLEFIKASREISAYLRGSAGTAEPHSPDVPLTVHHKFLLQKLRDAIGSYPQGLQYCLFVDGLDVRPSELAYDTYIQCVKGLANAVWILNATVFQQFADQDFKIVLLVRPDILHVAGLQNLNTKVRDNALLLDWRTDYSAYRNSALFRLADRLLASQQDPPEQVAGAAWDSYFSFNVFDRRTEQYTDAPFIPFLRSSFYRPRDILTYLEIMRQRMVALGEGDQDKFTSDVFVDKAIRGAYATYMLGEVRDSLSFYYKIEEFELFLKFFEFLSDYIDRRARFFSYGDFVKAFHALEEYAARNKDELPVIFQTPDVLLQFLYELNVICFKIQPANRKYPITRWCFRERSFANLRPKVKAGADYVLHYGMARALYTDIL